MNRTVAYSIIFVVVLVVAFKVASTFIPPPVQRKAVPTFPGDPTMAEVVCQKAVKEQLKAPATAQFEQVTPESLGSGRYRVTGPVDVQNSLGALLRSRYDCTVYFTGGNAYRIEHVSITP